MSHAESLQAILAEHERRQEREREREHSATPNLDGKCTACGQYASPKHTGEPER